MIEKGNVISNALTRLGNISDYNDDRSRTYQATDSILPLVLQKVCSDTSLNFSVSKVKLTQYDKEVDGEYRFNLPVDFLGIAKRPKQRRSVSNRIIPVSMEMAFAQRETMRLQGEFIYSEKSEITLYYNKKLPLSEFPDYMFDYITWKLATEMALMYPQFTERLQYCELKATEALYDIQKAEGLGVAYGE